MALVRGFEGVMSKVISFRLNPDNPREAQALEILRTKQAEGFSSRRVLTDALIGTETKTHTDGLYAVEEFNIALENVLGFIERINGGNQSYEDHQSTNPQLVSLNDKFLNSVRVAAKPGLNIE